MIRPDSDVLASPALSVLLDLEAAGVRFRIDGDRVLVAPRGAVTHEQREILANHREAARMLVTIVTDGGVQARRDRFQRQRDAAPPPTVPAFTFTANIPYVTGTCFSCGAALPELRFGRCWRCSLAWRLACRLPIEPALADALDGARVLT